ncbi:NAD-dependent epimerase/dehydratase family protein [Jiangella anatolica]|uniref:NAD-dependent dehydratase n=1 Tax=Jiangella anatolica TaxID=2670374 RepID=A0A2W2BKG2_9ACTN|nr:NAD(P)-dependent oxidoreductase [Jiangella anatolica]PZF85760.1 NAD-dependent dehydratase [Jiangella anatolica]
MTTVLVTGAAGRVAGMLRPGLDGLSLRVVDTRPVTGWDGADVVLGDLADPGFAAAALDGMDAVVHLAANPNADAAWPHLRGPNVDAVVTLLDAARAAGVPKVVLASSVHAMGGYPVDGLSGDGVGGLANGALIDPDWPARPCCTYGATKAFAEAYGRTVADDGGPAVLCLRLGAVLPHPTDTGNLRVWLSPGDLQRLIRAALAAELRYGCYFGVSANTHGVFSYANAMGYRPESDSAIYAADVPVGDGGVCRWRAAPLAV